MTMTITIAHLTHNALLRTQHTDFAAHIMSIYGAYNDHALDSTINSHCLSGERKIPQWLTLRYISRKDKWPVLLYNDIKAYITLSITHAARRDIYTSLYHYITTHLPTDDQPAIIDTLPDHYDTIDSLAWLWTRSMWYAMMHDWRYRR